MRGHAPELSCTLRLADASGSWCSVWLGLSALELLAAVALVLPALNKRFAIAAPIASAFIACEMLAFCVVHLLSGNPRHGELVYWLVVAAICGFVTYGRLVARPVRATAA